MQSNIHETNEEIQEEIMKIFFSETLDHIILV